MSSKKVLRRILFIIGGFMCYMMADGCTFSIGILYTEFLNIFHQSMASTAVLPGLIYAIPQFCGPIVCPLIDVIGSGNGAIIGGIILSISFFVSRFAVSFQLMYITLGFFASVGLEMTYVSAIMAVTKGFGEGKYLGLAIGTTVSGSGVGVFIFNPLLNYLIAEFLWQGAMIIESAIFLHVVVAGLLFRVAMNTYTLPETMINADKEKVYNRPKIQIEVVSEQKNNHSIFRQISLSHSAEALDILREPYLNLANPPVVSKQLKPIDDQRSSTILTKTQAKYCEPFHKPISGQNKSASLDRRISAGDGFSVQLPVDERTASFARRLSLYSSQNIKGSSQNIKGSHKDSRETLSSQPSLALDDTENNSNTNNVHLQSDYDIHLISDLVDQSSSTLETFLKDLKRSIFSLFSVQVWRNKNILLFYFVTLLFAMSVVVVWTFSYDNSIKLGITESKAALLISFIGAGSCFGQIGFGYISHFVPAVFLYSFGCIIAGLVTISLRYVSSYLGLALLHFLFGLSQGVCYALFSVILVHYTSVELYPASLAIYLLFSGSGNLIGTSLAGYVNDLTKDFGVSYLWGGGILAASGILVFPLICTWKSEKPLE